MAKKTHVSTTLNGESAEFLCEPRQSLLEVLRDTLRLTGAKEGCNNGNCGACTVMMNGVPVNSCIVLAVEAEGATVETIESLAVQGHLSRRATMFSGRSCVAMRNLHAWIPDDRQSAARQKPQPQRTRNPILFGE